MLDFGEYSLDVNWNQWSGYQQPYISVGEAKTQTQTSHLLQISVMNSTNILG